MYKLINELKLNIENMEINVKLSHDDNLYLINFWGKWFDEYKSYLNGTINKRIFSNCDLMVYVSLFEYHQSIINELNF